MHTVFSDGSVWPNIRVQEAQKDGVDFISTTEHLEYQPWKDDIPHPNRNRAYQVAKEYASNTDVIVINGSEITRNMPKDMQMRYSLRMQINFLSKIQ